MKIVLTIEKGGANSGNHGHSGRKGKVGGSMPKATVGAGGAGDFRHLSNSHKNMLIERAKLHAIPKPVPGDGKFVREDVVQYQNANWEVLGVDYSGSDGGAVTLTSRKNPDARPVTVLASAITGIMYHDGTMRDRNFNASLLSEQILAAMKGDI